MFIEMIVLALEFKLLIIELYLDNDVSKLLLPKVTSSTLSIVIISIP